VTLLTYVGRESCGPEYKLSDFVPFPAPRQPHELCLIGLRLDPTAEGPQWFTLIEQGEGGGRTIMAKGRILFFSSPALVARALQLAADDAIAGGLPGTSATSIPMPKQMDVLCDVAESLFLVNSQADDSDGVLVDCMACLDDLLRATGLNVPANYSAVFNALAERLERNSEFGSFLAERGIDRETVEDAILWCVGAIAVKSTWIG
jgi:hypothetical protein